MRGRLAVLFLVLVGALAACGGPRSDHAVIGVDAPVVLADQPVHLTVSDLAAGDQVIISASAVDYQQVRWRGQATFRADGHGVVDLDRARPVSGTYTGVDGMGLLWSMNPLTEDPAHPGFFTPVLPTHQPGYPVQVTVSAHGRQLAQRTLTRQWLAPGVTVKTLTLAADNVSGQMFLPPAGTPRHPAVLLLGGSEGGNTSRFDAALLASHGYPALSLAYFGEPGLPATLQNIPLEYFARAGRILAAQPGADPAHLVVRGTSRGTEAALLLGQNYPTLFHGIIVYAPSETANGAFPGTGKDAWTYQGQPITRGTIIPLTHVSGPVLAIAGGQDQLWDSVHATRQIMTELDIAGDRFPHQALIYPSAGHGVGTFPYKPQGTHLRHPITGALLDLGGSRAANAAARQQGWPQLLAFLTNLNH